MPLQVAISTSIVFRILDYSAWYVTVKFPCLFPYSFLAAMLLGAITIFGSKWILTDIVLRDFCIGSTACCARLPTRMSRRIDKPDETNG